VIPERVVLRRIKNFEQRCGWVATKITSQFVHLVQHQYRVAHPHPTYGLEDTPRQCPNIRAPVAAQFRFIVYTSQGKTLETSPQGASNGMPQTGLANARRSHKTQNGTFGCGLELHHRQVFDDAIFDVLETEVILIEDLLCPYQVQLVCRRSSPG